MNVEVVLRFGRLIVIRLHWGGIVGEFIVYVGFIWFICPRMSGCVTVQAGGCEEEIGGTNIMS